VPCAIECPKESALAQLYVEDKKCMKDLERCLVDESCDLFSLLVDNTAQQVVAGGTCDNQWRVELVDYVRETFCKTKKRARLITASSMQGDTMGIPDTLQVALVSDWQKSAPNIFTLN